MQHSLISAEKRTPYILASFILLFLTAPLLAAEDGMAYPPGFVLKEDPGDTFVSSLRAHEKIAGELKVKESNWYGIGPFPEDYEGLSSQESIDFEKPVTLDNGETYEWQSLKDDGERITNSDDVFPRDKNTDAVIYIARRMEVKHPGVYDWLFRSTWGIGGTGWLNGKPLNKLPNHLHALELNQGKNLVLIRLRFHLNRPRPIDIRMGWGDYLDTLYRTMLKALPGKRTGFVKEYIDLTQQARSGDPGEEYLGEVFHPAALIKKQDGDALNVVLRRTEVLLQHLENMADTPDLKKEKEDLKKLQEKAAKHEPRSLERSFLFPEACELRRSIAFKNPLINFDDILFLTHQRAKYNHMCDQYFGFRARPGGTLYRLQNAFSDQPEAIDMMADSAVENGRLKEQKLQGGAFISLDLDYDADRVAFAYSECGDGGSWSESTSYHVFSMNTDGTDLRMLTDGTWNEFDPCFKPDGRIAFISERRGGYGRCHGRPVPTYTVHDMADDGSDIQTISYHETNEWHPSVDNNGMLVYTRWDYVDRDSDVAHHIWISYPDGRDPRSYHGNYPINRRARPWMEMSIRAIPGSHRYISTAAPHHGQAYGSLIMIDQNIPDDNFMSQVKRITPDIPFPESEWGAEAYGTPWPLNENFYLAVYDSDEAHYGIWLVDAFGNRVEIFTHPDMPALDPIPFRKHPAPPAIPPMRIPSIVEASKDKPMGEVLVLDIYNSDFEWPENTQIDAIRVVQIFPKSTASQNNPRVGTGLQSLTRGVLGTAPVQPDGSVFFRVPVGVPVYFQALDKKGRAVQSMKSDTYLHEGERLTCLGCHEPKRHTDPKLSNMAVMALKDGPVDLKPEFEEAYPLSFPRLVQGVLDKKCVDCHAKEDKAPDLSTKEVKYGWSEAYAALAPFAWAKNGGNGSLKKLNGTSYSVPGQVGANASKLFEMLKKGHHDVKLTDAEMRRITLWLDTNSNFYGAYRDTDEQRKGARIMPELQ